MPKPKPKLTIKLNLLKPQSNPEKLPVKLFRWLLLSGRYIFVFVEALVLIAFGARFKLDADLAADKEAIEEQIPYIESLKAYEVLIRQTQLKLATIDNTKTNSPDWSAILKKIADQIPTSVKITAINIEKQINSGKVRIAGQTPQNNDLMSFIAGLKSDTTFSNVTLVNAGLEQGVIKFSLDATAKATGFKQQVI
ncbi:PilN domain-containing protein [Candidatus Daviesbacteria bacterium]|nr:PilN domain-containing protein [Candidatus Daviesbacteria bacterium]